MMDLLEKRILSDATVIGNDILKVDMFLNHQIDVKLVDELGKEFYRLFCAYPVTKILTVEASGIPIACAAARCFGVPVVFAKKGQHRNVSDSVYTADVFSFTKGTQYTMIVSKDYISSDDSILIIDDFLANGEAVLGLSKIISDAGASLCGVGIAIEKGFQPGGERLIKAGINLRSLAIIESMSEEKITFRSR